MITAMDWIIYQRDAGIISKQEADRKIEQYLKDCEPDDRIRDDFEEDVWRNM